MDIVFTIIKSIQMLKMGTLTHSIHFLNNKHFLYFYDEFNFKHW